MVRTLLIDSASQCTSNLRYTCIRLYNRAQIQSFAECVS